MALQTEAAVLREPHELTLEWLAQALGGASVSAFELEPIGTGQMSETRRVRLSYAHREGAGPASIVLKTASADPNSRAAGVGFGAYEREVRFYRELAPRIGGPLARCHLAVIDPAEGWFTLLLEDIADATQGDQIAGCGLEQARLAMHALAALHAPVFADPQLGATPWLNQPTPLDQNLLTQLLPPFFERYGERVAPEHRGVCERFVASLDGWSADRRPPLGLVHGDYRLDNMLFDDAAGRELVVADWQTVSWGPAMADAAYFLGGALRVEDRRAHERALVEGYFQALCERGVGGLDWERCWEEYRRLSFLGILMTVAPAMLVERTERGDEMFMTTLARYAQQVLDLDAMALVPEAGSGRPAPLRPAPGEESRHAPGPEELWNESWYFDAISADASIGLYTRLGLYPNLGLSWLTAFVCGPGRATVAVIDLAAPLPDADGLALSTERAHIQHTCVAELERFQVRLDAVGQAYRDASALLRGEEGEESVRVAFELQWQTLGVPYSYRMATRYEIPCRVSGSVQVGAEQIALEGLGQRDHSWGTRDWWSADWMWSAGHLEDGTRFHGVEFRIPQAPALGVGYLQPPSGELVELERVSASEQLRADGLIEHARISYGELELEVAPLAFGPLRLQARDGRVAHFPRAMCRVRASDGRAGVAWVEWNRNVGREEPSRDR